MSAQAISINVPRGGSMFRALLWKEWRQQRMMGLLLVSAPVAAYLSTFVPMPDGFRLTVLVADLLGAVALPLILGAAVFCAEQDDGTAEYLAQAPTGGLRIFAVKALTALIGALIGGALLLSIGRTVGLVAPGRVEWLFSDALTRLGRTEFAMIFGAGALLAILPALISTWFRRTLPCIFASAVAAAGLLWFTVEADAFYRAIYAGPEGPSPLGRWPLICVPAAILLAAPWCWCWARTGRPWSVKLWRGALVAVAIPLFVAAPFTARYACFTFLAGPATLQRWGMAGPVPGIWGAMGNRLPIYCVCPEWGRGNRIAIMNVDTGRYEWVAKWHTAQLAQDPWSPSGDRLLFQIGRPIWPTRASMPPPSRPRMLELTTGVTRDILSLCPSLESVNSQSGNCSAIGWMNDRTAAFRTSSPYAIGFADVESGTFELCRPRTYFQMWPLYMNETGVYLSRFAPNSERTLAAQGGRLLVSRFAPGLEKSEESIIPFEAQVDAGLIAISSDGRRMIGWSLAKEPAEYTYFLAALEPGPAPVTLIRTGANVSDKAVGFAWDGRVLLQLEGKLALLDPSDMTTTTVEPPASLDGPRIVRVVEISPSGRFVTMSISRPEPGAGRGYPTEYAVADLESGKSWALKIDPYPIESLYWLDDDRLIAQRMAWRRGGGREWWIMNRDGSGKRPLFGD
jgi:hypothetical protein